MEIYNPASGEKITSIKDDDTDSLKEKFALLRNGLAQWRSTPIKERIACIAKFGELLREERMQLAKDLTSEMGKTLQESINEINGARHKLKFFIEKSESLLAKKEVNVDGNTKESIWYEPLGVVVNISAWNYPYLVGVNTFIAGLVCGNSVFYKPSEYTSLTGRNIARLLWKAGVPKNVFQIAYGEGSIGEELLKLNADGYFFTGSYNTGQKIYNTVASKLVPVGLELGGKDPLYITDAVDDLNSVVESAIEGTFYNNGQSCCSIERIYIHENVYEEFTRRFIAGVKALTFGDPMDDNNRLGAITRRPHLEYLAELVKDAVDQGAKLEQGGSRVEHKGNYFEPTVLTNVHHKMKLMFEETFGPVIGLMKVSDDQEAIRLMNDTEYGLTASVFTNDQRRGESILQQINAGTGYLNCCDRVSGYLPWSGRKKSGLGSTLSHLGLYAFCHPKGIQVRGF